MGNKQIWKFEIKEGSIRMPIGAKILSVQSQRERGMIWALVDPNAEDEPRSFAVVGTGESFDETNMTYIGTYQESPFVWHLFEWKDKQQDNG
jgi:hypothetical protein